MINIKNFFTLGELILWSCVKLYTYVFYQFLHTEHMHGGQTVRVNDTPSLENDSEKSDAERSLYSSYSSHNDLLMRPYISQAT